MCVHVCVCRDSIYKDECLHQGFYYISGPTATSLDRPSPSVEYPEAKFLDPLPHHHPQPKTD